ncbi:MAG: HAD-IA family hydrolase [Nitrospirota bacterium]|nr:MAG: HAD-IA family hydrolase [Nitrospirota bacterium]
MKLEEAREALWTDVTHVLIDMDGTLLDKYFDDYFWSHLVPERYSEKNNISFGKARDYLFDKYRSHERTLNWTDIDFWSRELELDIPALKEQIRHLIDVHPYVEEFLSLLRKNKKQVIMATNAHYKTVSLKMKETKIGHYFDKIITSNEIGCPKEHLPFWERTQNILGFDRERTMFIDDTEDVLHAASDFGIKYIVFKALASSKEPPGNSNSYIEIHEFRELFPQS